MLPVVLAAAALTAAPDPKSLEWVKQLGSDRFAFREAAADKLIRGGEVSVIALTLGSAHTDSQVRERCRQLLPEAKAFERNRLIAVLLSRSSDPPPKTLPGIERFLAATGDTKPSRELYASMLDRHHQTLELIDRNPVGARRRFEQFIAAADLGRKQWDRAFQQRSDLAFFVFCLSDAKLRMATNDWRQSGADNLLYAADLHEALLDAADDKVCRLFTHWLDREGDTNLGQTAYNVAGQVGVRAVLPVARRHLLEMARSKGRPSRDAMAAVVMLGSIKDIDVMKVNIHNSDHVSDTTFSDGRKHTSQVRDIALYTMIFLAGRKRSDFGFTPARHLDEEPFSPFHHGFPDQVTREAAHAKWRAWVAANPLPEAGPEPRVLK